MVLKTIPYAWKKEHSVCEKQRVLLRPKKVQTTRETLVGKLGQNVQATKETNQTAFWIY